VRIELEAMGNMFMVKAVELDVKLQNLAKTLDPTGGDAPLVQD
jgi:hypothetical protein